MSTVRANNLEPQSGDVIRVKGRFVFEDPQPGIALASVNDIGVAGTQGFGVGICPNLPAGFSELSGTNDPASDNYGNYVYSDGSVMVWMPAYFYKWGTGANGLPVNDIDVKPFHAYTSVAAANAAGFALHRAFYDGGLIQPGVFVDKYHASNNGGIASSLRHAAPLSTAAAHNSIAALNGTPAENYGGVFAAVSTRGAAFFPVSRFVWSAIAMLAHAQAQAATSAAFCAWYDAGGTKNFPKGNNAGLALSDFDDTLLTFVSDGFDGGTYKTALTGSGSVFAKTTHNGQACGIADVNGNMWQVTPGMTYGTDGVDTGYWVLKTSVAMSSLTGGNTLATDAFGSTGIAANYDFAGAAFGYASAAGGARNHRFGNGTEQVLSHATSGLDWQMAGLALPLATGASSSGATRFGQDRMYDNGPSPSELCPHSGGSADHGLYAGRWALNLSPARSNSGVNVGLRAALYL